MYLLDYDVYYRPYSERPTVVGVLENRGAGLAGDIDVSVTFFSGSRVVGTGSDSLTGVVMGYRERVGFNVLMRLTSTTWDRVEVNSTFRNYRPTAYNQFAPALTIVGDSAGGNADDGYIVIGQVRNDDTRNAEFVKVWGLLYDAGGNIVDADYTYVDTTSGEIPAGGTAVFEINFDREGVKADKYQVFVYGSRK